MQAPAGSRIIFTIKTQLMPDWGALRRDQGPAPGVKYQYFQEIFSSRSKILNPDAGQLIDT